MKITIDVPDEVAEQLTQVGDRLSELVTLSLKQPAVPAQIYQSVLSFIISNPTAEEIAAFQPSLEMQERLKLLLNRAKQGELTAQESMELDEYERIEHLVIMLKAGNLGYLNPPGFQ